jgi:hypothetical protein
MQICYLLLKRVCWKTWICFNLSLLKQKKYVSIKLKKTKINNF